MADEYGSSNSYGNYGDGNNQSPYELLMQMKAWNKAIYLTIENMDNEVRTALQVLDGEIRQNILDVKQGLETNISTTAQGINARITDTNSNLATHVQVTAQGLASKVSQTDYNGNTVASLLTQTPTAINALAQSLNLSGYVTFSSLTAAGTTNIDGARITTGLISADRIQASTVLAKLIQAGGISADQITSGTISAARLSADAIRTTLLYAGGISADLITAGYISADRINGGTLSGVRLSTTQNADVGTTLTVGGNSWGSKMIRFGDGYEGITAYSGSVDIYGGRVTANGYDIVTSRTAGLGLSYSSTSKRLYVSINGTDVGFAAIT